MTVIAWDGRTLAGDRYNCSGGLVRTVRKINVVRDHLCGYAGTAWLGESRVQWFENGANPAYFPQSSDKDDWATLLCIAPDRSILLYEGGPHPIRYYDRLFAIGSGRDFALAAMHLGCDAEKAVKVASVFDAHCGGGVDTLTFPRRPRAVSAAERPA